MGTVTSELKKPDSPPCLLDRPQRLGVLPTMSFWRDPANWRIARIPIIIIVEIAMFAAVIPELPLPFYAVGVIPVVALLLSLGLFERYIRRQALKRRALAANAASKALPPAC